MVTLVTLVTPVFKSVTGGRLHWLHMGYTLAWRSVTAGTPINRAFAGFGYTVTLFSLILECLGKIIIYSIYYIII